MHRYVAATDRAAGITLGSYDNLRRSGGAPRLPPGRWLPRWLGRLIAVPERSTLGQGREIDKGLWAGRCEGRSVASGGFQPAVEELAMTTQTDETRPTIVLVHGAWADATGFDRQIRALQERGFRAVGFGNPLRGLPGDATYLAEFLRTVTGPIVLVGHSYGGMVISAAAVDNDQVKALVFFNGWAVDEGESQQQLLERFEGSLVGPAIRPVPVTGPDGGEGADLYLDPAAFHEAFAADVDRDTAEVMAAAQRPFAAAAFAGPSGPPAWKTLPCWYLLGTEDRAITPELQRFMAERANATIVEVPASHVSFLSQPEAAIQLILQAVEATAPTVSGVQPQTPLPRREVDGLTGMPAGEREAGAQRP
jgi:pimeloyl-ACP methyl ester carboxylesterase